MHILSLKVEAAAIAQSDPHEDWSLIYRIDSHEGHF